MLVLDVSVAVAWHFADERDAQVLAVRDAVVANGALVPAHFWLELANALLSAAVAGRMGPSDARASLDDMAALPIRIETLAPADSARAAFRVAAPHRLAAYDAAYLELAERAALPLATKDRALARAARARRVPLF
jgi:predicted nucleic acid-binding protein